MREVEKSMRVSSEARKSLLSVPRQLYITSVLRGVGGVGGQGKRGLKVRLSYLARWACCLSLLSDMLEARQEG